MDDPLPVVAIVGAGRSGSTLLERFLSTDDRTVALGETMYLWDRGVDQNQLCSCGEEFRSCPFWSQVMTRAFGGERDQRLVSTEARRLMRRTCRTRHVPGAALGLETSGRARDRVRFASIVRRLYRAALEVSGRTVVIDSSKEPQYALLLSRSPGFDISAVHLVRDARGVAYSWQRVRRRPEIHWANQSMLRRGVTRASQEWVRANLLAEVLRTRADHYVQMRYEDLVEAPEEAIRSVRLVGRDPGSLVTGIALGNSERWHSVSGNPVRFQDVSRVALDDEWKRCFVGADRAVTDAITLPLRRIYGYR